jgi:hypothetical protein
MASANNFAKRLVKKYAFKENVYQTDVAFSTNGDKMFVNGVDIDRATTIYEYNATQAYKSLNARLVSGNDVTGFTYDLSLNTDVYSVFPAAQALFDFKQGVSDMYQFVLDLSNGASNYGNFTRPITDSSAVRMVDNSNNAIQNGTHPDSTNHSIQYKAGVFYFTYNISYGAEPYDGQQGRDSSGGTIAGGATGNDLSSSLFHEVAKAKGMYELIASEHDKIIQQFTRIFFKPDGTKMYALYNNKNKGLSNPRHRATVLRTFDLTTPFSLAGVTSSLVPGSLTNHTLIYDLSLMFFSNSNGYATLYFSDGTSKPTSYSLYNILGLYKTFNGGSDTDGVREIMGFHISSDGKKIFFLANRGKFDSDPKITNEKTFFGEVTSFNLASDWNVTSEATFVSSALVYGNKQSSTSMDNVGVIPIDINFNHDGTRLHILGSEGKQEYVYTYQLARAYILPTSLEYGIRVPVKDALVSFSSANNSDGALKNVHGSGVRQSFATEIKAASVPYGNTFTIKQFNKLSSGLQSIVNNKTLTNVFEYEKPKDKSRPNNYFKYDPTQSKVLTTNGDVFISELKVNESKIPSGSTELTFIGLVSQDVNGETYYAIILNPSAVIPLQVQLVGGDTRDIIQSQPYLSDANVQGILTQLNGADFLQKLN